MFNWIKRLFRESECSHSRHEYNLMYLSNGVTYIVKSCFNCGHVLGSVRGNILVNSEGRGVSLNAVAKDE